MTYLKKLSIALLPALLCGGVQAGVANDVPSCYAASKIGLQAPIAETELFVIVDQTTPLDSNLQDSVRENVGRLVKPGSAFVVASFSSFGQGRYLEVLTAGTLEAPVAEKARDDIGVRIMQTFDACMKGQADFGRRTAAGALNKALAGSSPDFAKSDVMASLKELSSRVRQSKARNKIVFVVSDMLENSAISSFYSNRNVRNLDLAAELKKAESGQQIGDFGGARVFVLGAGLVQENGGGANRNSGIYRDPKTMASLRQFWSEYFTRSNAKLVEFGAPALLVPIQ